MVAHKELVESLEYEVYYVDANDDGHLVAMLIDGDDATELADLLNKKYDGGHQVFVDGKQLFF